MEDRKHLLDYLAQILQIFGISVLTITLLSFLLGGQAKEYSTLFRLGNTGVPVDTILQYLLFSVCITVSRYVFFTDFIFRKMSITTRTVLMLSSIIGLTGLFTYCFGWFPINDAKCWTMFFICFGISFVISFLVSRKKENMDNRKLEAALKTLKEEQGYDTDRGK